MLWCGGTPGPLILREMQAISHAGILLTSILVTTAGTPHYVAHVTATGRIIHASRQTNNGYVGSVVESFGVLVGGESSRPCMKCWILSPCQLTPHLYRDNKASRRLSYGY